MANTMSAGFGAPETQPAASDPMQKLAQLKKMFQAEFISEQEYSAKKKEILDSL
jgi:hypothetical protein